MNVQALADFLRETAEHHDSYEKTHPKHNWWGVRTYVDAHQRGCTP